MDENKVQSEETPAQPIRYATPVQRTWAWVGVVYGVILVLLTTYALAHGTYLRGIGGIMVSPALCGLGATVILRYKQGVGRGGAIPCVLISGVCFLLSGWNVIRGVPIILSQL